MIHPGKQIQKTQVHHLLLMLAFFVFPGIVNSQQEQKKVPDGTDGTQMNIPVTDSLTGKPTNLDPNEKSIRFTTFKLGMGFIEEYCAYKKDQTFSDQLDSAGLEMKPMFKVRDFRILVSGTLKTKRTITWKFAGMYDGDKEAWYVRESGIIIGVPEIFGHIFIGRTKEGYSLVKVMNGYSPWTAERQMALDVIPILADGIKWFGSLPKSRLFWNIGYYNDILSEGQGFSTFEWQTDARIGWLPVYDKTTEEVIHLGVNLRYGKPLNGQMTLKSRPEANPAPQIINTGSFETSGSTSFGAEAFYSSGRFLLGSEVMVHNFYSSTGDHHFIGGDVVATWLFTKTKRPYNTTSSVFGFVPVRKSVFKGGWGEFEGVLRFSTLDLTDGSVNGGKFWRITPMVNWYMSKIIRLELVYGYGVLDRFDLKGGAQFYQARIQLVIL